MIYMNISWLVVSTHPKNISQIGSFSQGSGWKWQKIFETTTQYLYHLWLPFQSLNRNNIFASLIVPIASRYGIFTYIYHKNQPNVGKYTIHGGYGVQQASLPFYLSPRPPPFLLPPPHCFQPNLKRPLDCQHPAPAVQCNPQFALFVRNKTAFNAAWRGNL